MAQPVFDAPIDLPPRIGKYIPVGELGRGGMGVVFLAEDTQLNRRVALKLLHPAFAWDEGFRRRFRAEASLVSQLNHPHIVRIHSLEETELGLAIDMEHLAGGSLADSLAKQGMTVLQVIRLVEKALDALQVCHEASLVHRDIKPSNILFDAHGGLRLSDFGLAKAADAAFQQDVDVTRSSTLFLGTPRYAPPEAWEGQEPTPQWDLYSLGVVMFECLAGRPPFQATSPLGLLREMAGGPPPALQSLCPNLSSDLLALGDGLYALDPSKRFASASEALSHLRSVPEYRHAGDAASDQTQAFPIRARRKRLANGSKERAGGRRRFVAGTIGVLLLAAVAFVTTIYPSSGPESVSPSPTRPVAMPMQAQAGLGPRLSLDGLASFSKAPPESYRVFRGIDLETGSALGEPAIAFRNDAGEYQLVVLTERGIRSFAWQDELGGPALGGWAAYFGAYGTLPRFGEIRGHIRGVGPDELICALSLIDEESGGVLEEQFRLEAVDATDTSALLAIEGHSHAQTLLYNELLPRRVPWALNLEAQLPALANARCAPIRVDDGAVAVDGRLDEAAWKMPALSAEREHPGLPGRVESGAASLHAAESERGLYFGLRIDPAPAGDIQIQAGVMRSLSIPVVDSPQRFVVTDSAGEMTSYSVRGQQQYPDAENPWTVAISRDGAALEAEIRLSLEAFGPAGLPPSFPAWRCNVAVASRVPGEESTAIAVWGAPQLADLQHGLLIRR